MAMKPEPHRRKRIRGFTLIELLVAVGILALMASMSWQGIDSMVRVQNQLQQRADGLLTLQAGLAQWVADLDALADGPPEQTLDWDSRSLRLLRRNTVAPGEGMLVVAWTRRTADGTGQWLRWQSLPVRTRKAQQDAWAQAARWAQSPGPDDRKYEVHIAPLTQWELFYFRNDAWTNPLSSGDTATTAAKTSIQVRPDGVRLVLTLPASEAISGVLVRDWIRPTLGGSKS